jgi:hypothetical protein
MRPSLRLRSQVSSSQVPSITDMVNGVLQATFALLLQIASSR